MKPVSKTSKIVLIALCSLFIYTAYTPAFWKSAVVLLMLGLWWFVKFALGCACIGVSLYCLGGLIGMGIKSGMK
jgi:hypothetical protein